MEIFCWICSCGEIAGEKPQRLKQALISEGVKSDFLQSGLDASSCVYLFSEITLDLQRRLQVASRGGLERVIAIAESGARIGRMNTRDLLRAGASDILVWSNPDLIACEIEARFERWRSIEQLMEEPVVRELVVAKSPIWRTVLRDVAEIARVSDSTVLLLGESGTGKEVVARLIHLLDPRPDKWDLVILDCSSIVQELSGSEFFGHERGSFTGAQVNGRAPSHWPTAAPCSWMRSANFRLLCKPNCCASFRNAHTNEWVGTRGTGLRFGWFARPIAIFWSLLDAAGFAPIFTIE